MSATLDASEVLKNLAKLADTIERESTKALFRVGGEILRLSSYEVPHDIGLLGNSAALVPETNEVIVGYNKQYAARLHEHPEYRFQKGRKGKYLEDPIKNNGKLLLAEFATSIKSVL